jgi:MFS family permease
VDAVTPARVVRTYLLLAGIYTLSASLIWGVNTLFLLDAGLDIAEVFIANAAFTLGMVLFEIPTGVVADTLGRRLSFLVSISVLFVSTLLYALVGVTGGGLVPFVVVSLGLGLGFTFYSGATEAWLVDALHATGFEGDLGGIFSRAQIVTGVAMMIGTIGGGLLGTIDLALPFLVRAALLVPVFGIAFALMHDLGFEPRPLTRATVVHEVGTVARTSATYGWRHREVRLLMLVSLFQTGFFIWGWYAWQPYFLDLLHRGEIWITGLISAAIALSMIVGNALVRPLSKVATRRTTILVGMAAVQTAAAVAVGLVDGFPAAFGMLVVFGIAVGATTPVKQAYLHDSIPSAQRATLVSFDSLVSNVGSVGGQVGLGVVARERGIAEGYVVGGAATALALPILLVLRRISGSSYADCIGPKDGAHEDVDAPCAAKGLPPIASAGAAFVEVSATAGDDGHSVEGSTSR